VVEGGITDAMLQKILASVKLEETIQGPDGSTLVCVDKPMSWQEANAYCKAQHDGKLVTIRNELSNRWLLAKGEFSKRPSYFWGGRCSWIGYNAIADTERGTRANVKGTWSWTGEEMATAKTTFEAWSRFEPNNCQGSVTGEDTFETACTVSEGRNEEDCAEACSDLVGSWNDQNCGMKKPFCCETGWWAACDEEEPCPKGYICSADGFKRGGAVEADDRRLLFGAPKRKKSDALAEGEAGCCVLST